MADFAHDPQTGDVYWRAPGNRWMPVQQEDIDVINESGPEAFMRQMGDTLAAPLRTAAMVGSPSGVQPQRQALQEAEQRSDMRAHANPGARLGGTVAGYAPDVALGAVTGGTGTLASRVGTTMAIEGTLGALRTPDDPITGAMIQAGVGGAVVGAGPMVNKFVNSTQRVVQNSRRTSGEAPTSLSRHGYRDPWYAGRGDVARGVGAGIESNPAANLATRAGKRAEGNQSALNRAVMEDIYIARPAVADGVAPQVDELNAITQGINELSPGFFDVAEERFVQQYDALAREMDDGVMSHVLKDTKLTAELDDMIGTVNTSVVRNADVDAVLTRVKERLDDVDTTAQDLMRIRSDLEQYAAQQATSAAGDPAVAEAASAVVDAINNATTRALEKAGKKEVLDEWKDITRRYMVMKAAQEGAAVNIGTGNVNATTMARNLSKPRRKKSGQKTASFEAARHYAGNATTGVPDSGTATRQLVNQMVTGGAVVGGMSILN